MVDAVAVVVAQLDRHLQHLESKYICLLFGRLYTHAEVLQKCAQIDAVRHRQRSMPAGICMPAPVLVPTCYNPHARPSDNLKLFLLLM